MSQMEEVMEYEVRGLERFLTSREYKNNIFGSEFLDSFERIIETFSSSITEMEIDKEIRKIQLLIFKIDSEKSSHELMNFMTVKIKQFLNNYLVAYILLKRLKQENNLYLPFTGKEEEQKHNKMSNAINLVRNTEVEFKHVKEFIIALNISI
ncbi:MAG: hypothetical protein ABRQ38_16705 [Candidatus Eremiobacterota bacterium]